MELEVVFTVTLTQTIGNCARMHQLSWTGLETTPNDSFFTSKRGQEYKPFGNERIRDDIFKVIQHIVGV